MKNTISDRQPPGISIKEEVDSQACMTELKQQVTLGSNHLQSFHAWFSNLDRIVRVDEVRAHAVCACLC